MATLCRRPPEIKAALAHVGRGDMEEMWTIFFPDRIQLEPFVENWADSTSDWGDPYGHTYTDDDAPSDGASRPSSPDNPENARGEPPRQGRGALGSETSSKG